MIYHPKKFSKALADWLDNACIADKKKNQISYIEMSNRIGMQETKGRADNLLNLRKNKVPINAEKLCLICNYFEIHPDKLIFHIQEIIKNQ